MVDGIDVRLREIFSKLFPVSAAELDDDARRGELDGWDSLGHLDLVSELEAHFAVTIDADRALDIDTFGAAKRVVASLLDNA